MIPVETAQQIVLDTVSALPAERRELLAATGCVLAETVLAPVSLPPFDNSAMDGYAVLAEDTRGARAESWQLLEIDRETDLNRLAALAARIRDALDDVHVAVVDWAKMRERAQSLGAGLEHAPAPLARI